MNMALQASRTSVAPRSSLPMLITWAVILALLAMSWRGADMRPMDLLRDSGNMAQFAADFFPPNFRDWRMYLDEMIVTVQIAVWGTFLAIVLAVPLGLLCSSNMVPAWVYQPMRRLMDACRAINEMVFAMLFIVAVGLGPFAGVLALWVHTTGVLAAVLRGGRGNRPAPRGGRAGDRRERAGGNRLRRDPAGVAAVDLVLAVPLRINVRSASVVGIVGAGGIGTVLWDIIRSFRYAETCAVMIIIVAFVVVIDMTSARIRKALV